MIRRSFIKKAMTGSVFLGAGSFPMAAFNEPEILKLTILHTNDQHSRIEPFESGRLKGLGGAARRATLLENIRKVEQNVLLLDSGDIFQGTPYFNYFGGELEFKLMSKMKYDATTIGNHDFDAGMDGLLKQLPHANFPFLTTNYNFSDTPLEGQFKPYKIFQKENIRIGVFGLGIELNGLVPGKLYGNTQYQDPLKMANKYATILKEDEKCDYVICLSHLGYKYSSNRVSDQVLARESENIDLILGGHTHTFMDAPEEMENKKGEKVFINQVGFGGVVLGRLDVYFEKNFKNKCTTCKNITVKD
jgi:5'-nucleotidase